MEKYKVLLWLILSQLIVFAGCNTNTEIDNHTNFTIPPEFEIIEHDSNSDEILAVKYKDEMQIIVSKNMSKIIKESALFGSGVMKQIFETKFPLIVKKHNGRNVSGQNHYYINENIYLYQSFDYMVNSTPGYYEYGALHIEQPEEYFEFFITGDKTKKENHKPLIKSFLSGVK